MKNLIEEIEKLRTFDKPINVPYTDETEIDVKMGKLHCNGYFCSEPLPKELVLELLKCFRAQYTKCLKDLEQRTGLVKVVQE